MIGLTKRQNDILSFIKQRITETDVPPSFDEMKDHLGLSSKSGIARLITGLEERGLIRRMHNRARAIEIVDPAKNDLWFLSASDLEWVDYGAQRRGIAREAMVAQILSDWARVESTRTRRPLPEQASV